MDGQPGGGGAGQNGGISSGVAGRGDDGDNAPRSARSLASSIIGIMWP